MLVDNTVATPVNCRPLEWGADAVMHSATKYLNGHSDVLAGVAAGREALMSEVRTSALELGATLSPDSAWLVRRGIRTLHLRVERAGQNAMRIAEFLEAHPRVIRVVYPGLASHPAYDVARRILDGYGAMLAFEVEGGRPAGEAVMDRVRLCVRATSLGGVETVRLASRVHKPPAAHRRRARRRRDPSRRPPPGGGNRGRQRSDRGPRAGASVTPERRVSPWWMLLPALLFVLNFIGGLTQDTGDRANAVYDLSTLVASGAIEAALAGYAVLAARLSAQPIAETLAIRRVPLRAALVTGAIGLVVILASEAVLDPIFNGGAQQGIEPTHNPETTHQWVAVGVAVLMLVIVAPVAEELIFRGLGFAALGQVAVPVTSLLFAIAHGLPSLLVEVAVAGLVLAEIRRRTDSVLPGMGVHMAFNGLALVVAFLTV